MKTFEAFKNKDGNLKKAFFKVSHKKAYLKRLILLKPYNSAIGDKLNALHDLSDRLADRLWDNFSAFNQWHCYLPKPFNVQLYKDIDGLPKFEKL